MGFKDLQSYILAWIGVRIERAYFVHVKSARDKRDCKNLPHPCRN